MRYRIHTLRPLSGLTAADFIGLTEQSVTTSDVRVWGLEVDGDYTEEQLRPTTRIDDDHWATSVPGVVWVRARA